MFDFGVEGRDTEEGARVTVFLPWACLLGQMGADVNDIVGDYPDGQRELHWSTNRI